VDASSRPELSSRHRRRVSSSIRQGVACFRERRPVGVASSQNLELDAPYNSPLSARGSIREEPLVQLLGCP